ncbi:MAG: DUF3488 domain-containing protein [Acidobacteriales bacterium]|nr:DUF3488 domain-containing protein [Terriglobales bacterium]
MNPGSQTLQRGVEQLFQSSLFLMIVVGFVALSATGKLDPLSLLAVPLALMVRGYFLYKDRPIRLTEQTTSRLTVFYVAFYAADLLFLSGSFITATVHLVLFIMVVTMFSVQRERYHVYLSVIAFLMVLSAAILTIDSFFLGAFFVFLLLAAMTFITFEMRRSFRDLAGSSPKEPQGAVASADTPASLLRGRLGKSLGAAALAMILATFAASPLIFYLIPRWSFGRLSSLAARNSFVSGFTDNVKLGEIGRIQQVDTVVMHVQFSPESLKPPADMKFRGVTLGQFDGKTWFNRPEEMKTRIFRVDSDRHFDLTRPWIAGRISGLTAFPRRSTSGEFSYRVLLEPIGTNAFFLLTTPTEVFGEERNYFVDGGGTVAYLDPTRQIRSYRATAIPRTPTVAQRAAAQPQYPQEISDAYLQVPRIDPRVRELAESITRNVQSPYEKAAAIEGYLLKNFTYTLQLESGGDDPLADFLLVRKRGHCEYFASAMAILLREVGVPTRIVNGFRGGELNDISGSYIVRARDAHSWVEVYIAGHGWTEFDPTPPAEIPATNAWARFLLYVDAAREFWGEWVINYDVTRQTTLAETSTSKAREVFDRIRGFVRDRYDALLERARETQRRAAENPRAYALRTGVAAGLLLVLLNLRALFRMITNFRLARKPRSAPRAAASIWYERLVRMLRKRGIEKTPGQTPQELAASVPAEMSGLRHRIKQFTEHYEMARFGGDQESAARLPALYQALEESLQSEAKR